MCSSNIANSVQVLVYVINYNSPTISLILMHARTPSLCLCLLPSPSIPSCDPATHSLLPSFPPSLLLTFSFYLLPFARSLSLCLPFFNHTHAHSLMCIYIYLPLAPPSFSRSLSFSVSVSLARLRPLSRSLALNLLCLFFGIFRFLERLLRNGKIMSKMVSCISTVYLSSEANARNDQQSETRRD